MKQNKSRRQFLKGMIGGFGAIITTRLGGIFPEGQLVNTQAPRSVSQGQVEQSEFYAGFVLLPDIDTPVPSYVQIPPSIILHDGDIEDPATGNMVTFSELQELAAYVPFPLYVPMELPEGIEFMGGEVVEFANTQDIYEARALYGTHNTNQSTKDISIVVSAKYEYPQPFPVWPSRGQAPQPDDQGQILPEKVSFTPSPGVLLPNAIGHQIHWLQEGDNVAYTLLAEHDPSRGAAEQLARSLVTI